MSTVYQKYELLIEPLRARARELGYAIGVHGSLNRDIDLIACPWSDDAVSERELAEELHRVVEQIYGQSPRGWHLQGYEYTLAGAPCSKPHGRLGWIFYADGTPIDLSVMPRQPQ